MRSDSENSSKMKRKRNEVGVWMRKIVRGGLETWNFGSYGDKNWLREKGKLEREQHFGTGEIRGSCRMRERRRKEWRREENRVVMRKKD